MKFQKIILLMPIRLKRSNTSAEPKKRALGPFFIVYDFILEAISAVPNVNFQL